MTAKKNQKPLQGTALIKETCRRIRTARSLWDSHKNKGCRAERERAVALYEELTEEQKKKIPQALRVWLRYRSEKYFGKNQKGNGAHTRKKK